MYVTAEEINKKSEKVIKWTKKLSKNDKLSPRDFLKEGMELRNEILEAYNRLFPRLKRTGEAVDPMIRAIEDTTETNSERIQKELWKLVYNGNVTEEDVKTAGLDLLEELLPISKDYLALARDESAVKAAKCLACVACTACTVCATCGACFACLVTGVVALGITSAISAVSSVSSVSSVG
jgi:hypothetical protein